MIQLNFRPQTFLLAMPLLSLAFCNYANAEVYKWRDDRGITQYSDRPPVSTYSKLTPNELVNSVQTKDLCTINPAKKNDASNVASAKDYSGFFLGKISATNRIATANNASAPVKAPITTIATLGTTKTPTPVFTLPIAVKPPAPAVTLPPITQPTKPAPTTPTVTAPSTPVTTTPTPTPAPSTPVATAPTTPTGSGTSANIVQTALMPAVDVSKNIAPAAGWPDLRIRPNIGPQDVPPVGDGDGQFRIDCDFSHMSNDDPILYPNQQGAAHHHTFFGNTSVNYKSNLMTLNSTGNSTCRGGIANRSAYWVPSMIDTATNTPIKPISALWYYKTGYAVAKSKITAPPKGLRIISGNMKATSAATSRESSYNCFLEGQPSVTSTHIPACKQGWTIVTHVGFPQCWDGKNLDSPDHYSHMAYPSGGSCPATHPVAIPAIGLNVKYLVTSAEGTKNWRLSSDNYPVNGQNAGYSGHGDWVNGWDEKVIAGIVKNCLNAGKDCGSHMLGDGTVIYGANRDF